MRRACPPSLSLTHTTCCLAARRSCGTGLDAAPPGEVRRLGLRRTGLQGEGRYFKACVGWEEERAAHSRFITSGFRAELGPSSWPQDRHNYRTCTPRSVCPMCLFSASPPALPCLTDVGDAAARVSVLDDPGGQPRARLPPPGGQGRYDTNCRA